LATSCLADKSVLLLMLSMFFEMWIEWSVWHLLMMTSFLVLLTSLFLTTLKQLIQFHSMIKQHSRAPVFRLRPFKPGVKRQNSLLTTFFFFQFEILWVTFFWSCNLFHLCVKIFAIVHHAGNSAEMSFSSSHTKFSNQGCTNAFFDARKWRWRGQFARCQ
jgi:hypothetical protein